MIMKTSRGENVFNAVNVVFMIVLTVTMLLPFLNVISISLMPDSIISKYRSILFLPFPKEITFESYSFIFSGSTRFPRVFLNTLYLVFMGTFTTLICTMFTAYALSKKDLRGRKILLKIMIFTMLFPSGLIPNFMMVKYTQLIDTFWAIFVPGLVDVWAMFIFVTFFRNLPQGVEESAHIDGANDITIFFRIVIPLSMPIIATYGLFYAVGFWNTYIPVLLYINDRDKWTLQILLKQVLQDV